MNEKNKNKYGYLIGLTKKEVLEELGDAFNFYPGNIWSYVLKVSWLRRKTILFIYFANNRVESIEIRKSYRL